MIKICKTHNVSPGVIRQRRWYEPVVRVKNAIAGGVKPAVPGEAGRRTVELFTAIYRSTCDNLPIKFPLKPEPGFDGRG